MSITSPITKPITRPITGEGSQPAGSLNDDVTGQWFEGNSGTPDTSVYSGGKITVIHYGDSKLTRWHTQAPSGDFEVAFKVRLSLVQTNFVACGAWVGTSTPPEERLHSVGYLSTWGNNRRAWQWWRASDNGFIGEGDLESPAAFPTDAVEYWSIKRTGSTIEWSRSDDGLAWATQHTWVDDGFMLGPVDRVGILLNTNGVGVGVQNSITLEKYSVLSGTLPAQSGTFTTSAGGPYLVSPAGVIPAGTSKITVAVECTPASEALQGLFTFGSDFYGSTNSAGAINMQVVDDGGSDVLSATRTGKHKLLAGQLQTIILSVDLVGSLTVSRIDSGGITIIGSYPITQPNSGAFSTGLALTLLRDPWLNSQFMGSVDAMRVWFGAATTDGSEPATPPDIEITGPASVINTHPWKLGADAT